MTLPMLVSTLVSGGCGVSPERSFCQGSRSRSSVVSSATRIAPHQPPPTSPPLHPPHHPPAPTVSHAQLFAMAPRNKGNSRKGIRKVGRPTRSQRVGQEDTEAELRTPPRKAAEPVQPSSRDAREGVRSVALRRSPRRHGAGAFETGGVEALEEIEAHAGSQRRGAAQDHGTTVRASLTPQTPRNPGTSSTPRHVTRASGVQQKRSRPRTATRPTTSKGRGRRSQAPPSADNDEDDDDDDDDDDDEDDADDDDDPVGPVSSSDSDSGEYVLPRGTQKRRVSSVRMSDIRPRSPLAKRPKRMTLTRKQPRFAPSQIPEEPSSQHGDAPGDSERQEPETLDNEEEVPASPREEADAEGGSRAAEDIPSSAGIASHVERPSQSGGTPGVAGGTHGGAQGTTGGAGGTHGGNTVRFYLSDDEPSDVLSFLQDLTEEIVRGKTNLSPLFDTTTRLDSKTYGTLRAELCEHLGKVLRCKQSNRYLSYVTYLLECCLPSLVLPTDFLESVSTHPVIRFDRVKSKAFMGRVGMIYCRSLFRSTNSGRLSFKMGIREGRHVEMPYTRRAIVVSHVAKSTRWFMFLFGLLRTRALSQVYGLVRSTLCDLLAVCDRYSGRCDAESLAFACASIAVSRMNQKNDEVAIPADMMNICEWNAHLMLYRQVHTTVEQVFSGKLQSCKFVITHISRDTANLSIAKVLDDGGLPDMLAFELLLVEHVVRRAFRDASCAMKASVHTALCSTICERLSKENCCILSEVSVPYDVYLNGYMDELRTVASHCDQQDSDAEDEGAPSLQRILSEQIPFANIAPRMGSAEFEARLTRLQVEQCNWNARSAKNATTDDCAIFLIPSTGAAMRPNSNSHTEYADVGKRITDILHDAQARGSLNAAQDRTKVCGELLRHVVECLNPSEVAEVGVTTTEAAGPLTRFNVPRKHSTDGRSFDRRLRHALLVCRSGLRPDSGKDTDLFGREVPAFVFSLSKFEEGLRMGNPQMSMFDMYVSGKAFCDIFYGCSGLRSNLMKGEHSALAISSTQTLYDAMLLDQLTFEPDHRRS